MGAHFTTPDGADLDALMLDAARARHMRRQLHEALDHGFALLDALDLGPAALDEIDHAIRVLDALDAPDEDREPWLAGVSDLAFIPGAPALDAEDDSEEDEGTALESAGRGLVRAGPDDAEAEPDDEDDELGDERDSGIGDPDGYHEQCGFAVAGALPWSVGGYVA